VLTEIEVYTFEKEYCRGLYVASTLYLGFQAQGFTAEDFNVMCSITSWATCGPAHSRGMSIHEEHDDTYTDGRRSDGH
jgi:Methyltransferase TRM13.